MTLSFVCFCYGCGSPSLPNKVTPDEYEIYTAWVNQHFEKNPPKKISFNASTINEKSLYTGNCGEALRKDGVSQSMIEALAKRNGTFYPLDFQDKVICESRGHTRSKMTVITRARYSSPAHHRQFIPVVLNLIVGIQRHFSLQKPLVVVYAEAGWF